MIKEPPIKISLPANTRSWKLLPLSKGDLKPWSCPFGITEPPRNEQGIPGTLALEQRNHLLLVPGQDLSGIEGSGAECRIPDPSWGLPRALEKRDSPSQIQDGRPLGAECRIPGQESSAHVSHIPLVFVLLYPMAESGLICTSPSPIFSMSSFPGFSLPPTGTG